MISEAPIWLKFIGLILSVYAVGFVIYGFLCLGEFVSNNIKLKSTTAKIKQKDFDEQLLEIVNDFARRLK